MLSKHLNTTYLENGDVVTDMTRMGYWRDKEDHFQNLAEQMFSGNLNVYYQSMKLTTHLLDQNLKHSKYLTFLTRNQTFRNVSNDKN